MLLKAFKKMASRKKRLQPLATAWDASSADKRLKNWMVTSDSINSLIAGSQDVLRGRSRQVVLNSPIASNAIDTIVSNCIGSGIKPQAKASDREFKERVQEAWLQWKDEADHSGITNFYGFQALALRSVIEAGECFVKMVVRKPDDGLTVPLQLQLLESEHLDSSKNDRFIRQGIEFNRSGERIAYHLYREHPGDNNAFSDFESVRVPASDVLHLYKPIRPGQIRGVPWLSSVLLKLYDLDQYDDAELIRKKTAALFAGFIKRTDPETSMLGEEPEFVSEAELEPGIMQYLEPGEDIEFSKPTDVGGSYEAFMRQQLRFIAMGMGISYEQLTGDLTQVNFSSIRAGLIEFRRKCEMLQRHLIMHQLCRPVWKKWLELALLSGAVAYPKNKHKFMDVKWVAQGWEWVDPVKDLKAQEIAMKNGLKSRAEVVSALGHDVEDIDEEIAADNARADKLGLEFDSDSRIRKK